jgi:hypothetical protein
VRLTVIEFCAIIHELYEHFDSRLAKSVLDILALGLNSMYTDTETRVLYYTIIRVTEKCQAHCSKFVKFHQNTVNLYLNIPVFQS